MKKIYITLANLYETMFLSDDEFMKEINFFANSLARPKGSGIEYDQSREYVQGDSIRNVDWRASSKGKGLFTKLYKEDFQLPTYILVEQSSKTFFSSSDTFKSYMLSLLASKLAWATYQKKNPLGAFIFDDSKFWYHQAGAREDDIAHIFRELVIYNNALNLESVSKPAGEEEVLVDILKVILQKRIKGSLFLLLDIGSLTENVMNSLKILVMSGIKLTIVACVDELESNIDLAEDLRFFDGSQTYLLDSSDEGLRLAWQDYFNQKLKLWQDFANRYNINLDIIKS